jgi:hypothetical protein
MGCVDKYRLMASLLNPKNALAHLLQLYLTLNYHQFSFDLSRFLWLSKVLIDLFLIYT